MNPQQIDIITTRRNLSQQRLDDLRDHVKNILVLKDLSDLCIYVTGSYGRLEASNYSDLDLFFIHKGAQATNPLLKKHSILLNAKLIELASSLGFPEFSNDGEYLTVHYLDDIRDKLGSQEDDFRNYFTARILLLLESHPIFNDDLYKYVIEQTIDNYYRDYHDHEASFRPIFLINDILRFWKTLCLNYEHKRNRPPTDEHRRNKNHLKNLKLKFSRMLTCFSAVILLVHNCSIITPSELALIISKSPLERLDYAASLIKKDSMSIVDQLKSSYAWFLDMTNLPENEVLEWISNHDTRNEVFERGRQFGTHMYKLLQLGTAENDTMRFLVI